MGWPENEGAFVVRGHRRQTGGSRCEYYRLDGLRQVLAGVTERRSPDSVVDLALYGVDNLCIRSFLREILSEKAGIRTNPRTNAALFSP